MTNCEQLKLEIDSVDADGVTNIPQNLIGQNFQTYYL